MSSQAESPKLRTSTVVPGPPKVGRRSTGLSLIGLTLLLPTLASHGNGQATGSVTLPLAEYLDLVERVDQVRRQPVELAVAELVEQTTRARVENGIADLRATYRVELRGRPTTPVVLPMTGLAESFTVEPPRDAALHRAGDDLLLVATRPGSYTVEVDSRAELEHDGGVSSLVFARTLAPVATLDLDLPADLGWTARNTVEVEEEPAGARRRLLLAPVRGQRAALDLQRRVTGAEEEQARVRAVAVTVARVSAQGLERHDLVLYDVERGELGRFVVDVPGALEVRRAATDEGPAVPLIEAGRLTVERQRRLSANGRLVLTYRPQPPDAAGDVFLPPVEPRVPVRSRYLVLASDRAAAVEPLPQAAWRRVDVDDLPRALRREIAGLGPSAVWRRTDVAGTPRLQASLLAAVDRLGALVRRRSTSTLLTVDGSLVHRERFSVERSGTAFEIALPAAATLWSVQVDGQAVRPVERGQAIAVPLVYKADGATQIELVAVEERSIARGASQLAIELAQVAVPVLEHQWRLLLPEQHRYRLAASELRPAPPDQALGPVSRQRITFVEDASSQSSLVGTVADESGAALPGVTLSIQASSGYSRAATTDAYGRFRLPNLAAQTYRVSAELEGFATETRTVELPASTTANLDLALRVAEVVEEIVVTAQVDTISSSESLRARQRERMQAAAQRELQDLGQGLVGGVKPLRVEVPESGKLLLLTGVLPPARIAVELEVKSKR